MPTGPASDTESGTGGSAKGGTAGIVGRVTTGPGNGPSNPGKRRLGVMGGTFDPIHHGHLVAASEVATQFHLDEVVFVPTGQPWQKTDRKVTPAEDRYLMTVIATAENPQFSVSRIDIDRGGPTYTTDTLRDLRALNPDTDLFFITGADALAQLLTWRDTEELFSLAHFIGVTRPGSSCAATASATLSMDNRRPTTIAAPRTRRPATRCITIFSHTRM